MFKPTQEEITKYVKVVSFYPLKKGQLEAMVILHFDIPDKKAKIMIKELLKG